MYDVTNQNLICVVVKVHSNKLVYSVLFTAFMSKTGITIKCKLEAIKNHHIELRAYDEISLLHWDMVAG